MENVTDRKIAALAASEASVRLKAALAIGSSPEPVLLEALLTRCAIEPDFFVRDMLTWAVTRFPAQLTVPRLVAETGSAVAQARSQALHTLSKIRDATAWPAITPSLLRDADDEVARSAWRAAVVLVPDDQKEALAQELVTQLGRGDRNVQLSLSRALLELGAETVEPLLRKATASEHEEVRAHASATERLLRDPNAAFELDLKEAIRVFVLSKER
jgi:HEAT repeat protein